MQPADVIANIDAIYERFSVMPQIADHMRQVAAVADYVAKHWKGQPLERDLLVAACLVHDLANILKVRDFDSPQQHRMLGAEASRVEHWKSVQQQTELLYGSDDHVATERMLAELGASPAIADVFNRAKSLDIRKLLHEGDEVALVYLYADNRVGPFGIISLQERIADIKARYPGYFETPERVETNFEEMLPVLERYLAERSTPHLPRFSEKDL
jgi:hypothetical protein